MFSKSYSKSEIVKKVNWRLSANFFTLEDVRKISERKLRKVIKAIALIEEVKLSRKEIADIALFVKSEFKERNKTVIKLWEFLSSYFEIKTEEEPLYNFDNELLFINTYRNGRFELMLN